MEVLICETIISGVRLRLYEHHGTALPFALCESTTGHQATVCRDSFSTMDAATQAYLDRRRELRAERGL